MTELELAEKRHKRALRIIKRWRLMDDEFMKRCLKGNIPAVQCILSIIMGKPDLVVQTVRVEDTIPNLMGRGVRLDVHAIDSKGRQYDIEIQRSDQGAGYRRARYNSSLLDMNSLGKGEAPELLPETYVIFITEHDVMKRGLARYHINRWVEELNERFEDGEHILYVNGAYEGQDDIGKLMHDFRASDPADMLLEPLKETVNRYKNNPEEVAQMCMELEKWGREERNEGKLEGREEGRAEGSTQAEGRMSRLIKLLISRGQKEEALEAAADEKLRQKLYAEYGI